MGIVHGKVSTFLDPGSDASHWKLERPHPQEIHVLADAEGAALCLVAFGLQCQPSLTFFCSVVQLPNIAFQHGKGSWIHRSATPGLYTSLNAFDVSPSNPAAMTLMSLVLTKKRLMREDILVTLDQRACFPRSLIPQLEFQGRGSSGGRQWQASQVWSFCFRCLSESDRATGSPQVPTSSHEMQVVMRTLMKRVGICIHMALQSGLSHANVFLASCLDLFWFSIVRF